MACKGDIEVRAKESECGSTISVECTGCTYVDYAEASVLALADVLKYERDHDSAHRLRDVTRVRHQRAPDPSGCRWCGTGERGHGSCFVRSIGQHTYVPPTMAQRKARMLARRRGL